MQLDRTKHDDIIDIHPHIISDDEKRYPPAPLFGKRSDWSQERPNTVETLIAAMDEAGVAKAAVVHSSTTYGFDNSYVVDGCASIRTVWWRSARSTCCSRDAPAAIREWVGQAASPACASSPAAAPRTSTPASSTTRKSFPAWELCGELGLPMCIQTGPIGLPQVTHAGRSVSRTWPSSSITLGRPEVPDGAAICKAASLFELAPLRNIYLKLTPRIFGDVKKGKASAETFFPRVVEAFGAKRMAWGSNYPTSPGTLAGDPGDG